MIVGQQAEDMIEKGELEGDAGREFVEELQVGDLAGFFLQGREEALVLSPATRFMDR